MDAFRPHYRWTVDRTRLVRDAGGFFHLPQEEARALYRAYRRLHWTKLYRWRLKEKKTLCFEEAFLLYVALRLLRPLVLVEIGTYRGKSTRRILDMKKALGLETRVVCFDVEDHVGFFSKDEAELRLEDVTGHVRDAVFQAFQPGVVFLDARPYHLLKDVIGSFVRDEGKGVLFVHDCAAGLCNPRMSLSRDDPRVSSGTGVWERHVLAEIFGVADPLSPELEARETPTHRLRIFDTPHGLAAIAPRRPPGA